MRRRPLFYVFNMVFPCMLITLVAFLGFYLPPGSTEKVSIGITTLLSITVFLMLVAESMPPTSEQLPLLGIYYAVTIGIVSFSTTMAVITLNVNNKGSNGRRVPRLVRLVFFRVLARLLCTELSTSRARYAAANKHLVERELSAATAAFSNSSSNNNTNAKESTQNEQLVTLTNLIIEKKNGLVEDVLKQQQQQQQTTTDPFYHRRHYHHHHRHQHHRHNRYQYGAKTCLPPPSSSSSMSFLAASTSLAAATRHAKQRDYYFGPSPIIKHNRRANVIRSLSHSLFTSNCGLIKPKFKFKPTIYV